METKIEKKDIIKSIIEIIIKNDFNYSEAEEILMIATKYLKKTKLSF